MTTAAFVDVALPLFDGTPGALRSEDLTKGLRVVLRGWISYRDEDRYMTVHDLPQDGKVRLLRDWQEPGWGQGWYLTTSLGLEPDENGLWDVEHWLERAA